MWIWNQVWSLSAEYAADCLHLFDSSIFCVVLCLFFTPPLCIHGNSCPLGQLLASVQTLNVLVDQWELGFNLTESLLVLWWVSTRDVHTGMTLDGGNDNMQQLCIFIHVSRSLCFLKWQLLTLILWYVEPCRYGTAWKHQSKWTSLGVDNISVVILWLWECWEAN